MIYEKRFGYAFIDYFVKLLTWNFYQVKPKGVTMTVLLAKAAAMALAKHPVVNASCKDGKSFTYNESINIAVAVAIDGGLITPVLQDADKVVKRYRSITGQYLFFCLCL